MGLQISIRESGDVTILDLQGRATIGAESDLLSVGSKAADEGSSRGADEIGHLEGRPAHLFVPLFVFQLQRVQRTRGRVEVTFGEMEVDGGLFQIAMA